MKASLLNHWHPSAMLLAAAIVMSPLASATEDDFTAITDWRLFHFGQTDNSGNAANTADPDDDGIRNILEYALCLNPNARDMDGRPTFTTDSQSLFLNYTRARPDIEYVVEGSTNLVSWSTDNVDQGSAAFGPVTASVPMGHMVRLRVYQTVSSITGLTESDTDALTFVVNTSGWADLTYRLNDGPEVTVRMSQADGQNRFTLDELSEGDIVDYRFAYFADVSTVESEWLSYTFESNAATYSYIPLYDETTVLEQELQTEDTNALYTYFSDRARDRHAREDQSEGFKAYDHYLSHYWEHRTVEVEIIDEVAKGGNRVVFRVRSLWKFKNQQAELRAWYLGVGSVAEYWNNGSMIEVAHDPQTQGSFFQHFELPEPPPKADTRYYERIFSYNEKEGRAIQVGDRMEFELSQFLEDNVPNGRANYYGTTYLYIVGKGLVPWYTVGTFGDATTEREDSYEIPEVALLGGDTSIHYLYSDEPDNHFLQMATNTAPHNGQKFMHGRRLHHTDFEDGHHTELDPETIVTNPPFAEMAGKLGNNYINASCIACHGQNGRALPPEVGGLLDRYAVKVGNATGGTHPLLGKVLQPKTINNNPAEARAYLDAWEDVNGLRKPIYRFETVTPETFSARIAPQLVGMGLLEAIPESAIEALADPNDEDGDGISGRMHIVTDPETGQPRLGRFGWKAGKATVRHQIASAYNTDMGVMTSLFPNPDQGSAQTVESTGVELSDEHLKNHTAYVSLLGVRPQRGYDDKDNNEGGNFVDPWLYEKQLFANIHCAACHTPSFQTSSHHPLAELRNQTIYPYTDLLLHDMGPGLADNLGEGDASGSEWRTPPLWGIGLTAGISVDEVIDERTITRGEGYLHDGRARTLEEAILWHGGEAQASKEAYEALSQEDKDRLINFLKSL